MPIDCYECRGLGDDYRIEDGELVSNCDGCPNNETLPDREKVISRLQIIRTWAAVGKDPIYNGIEPRCCEDIVTWIDDALALLKEQEAVEPVKENYWPRTYGRCGNCKAPLPAIEGLQSKFCWMCGRRVKWDA